MNLKKIKANYQSLSDKKLCQIAISQSQELMPEVVELLKEELKRRNLSLAYLERVDAETNAFEGMEYDQLVSKIESLPCPNCKDDVRELNGYNIEYRVSFLIESEVIQRQQIICKSCGTKAKWNAILKSMFLGWWSGKGLLMNSFTILSSSFEFMQIEKIHKEIMQEFIQNNTGIFRLKGIEPEVLQKQIVRNNANTLS